MAESLSLCKVLLSSPYKAFHLQEEKEDFLEAVSNSIAPFYHFKSVTTILLSLSVITYVTLIFHYPPYVQVPSFALQLLTVSPQNLIHFQFYRIFTAPFAYPDLNTLIFGCLVLWPLGSWAESKCGWKMLLILSPFSALIGYADYSTLIYFLIGFFLALKFVESVDSRLDVNHRKITLLYYIAIFLIASIIVFIWQSHAQKCNIYASIFNGFFMTFNFMMDNGPLNTFRKNMKLASGFIFIASYSAIIVNIIFFRMTIV